MYVCIYRVNGELKGREEEPAPYGLEGNSKQAGHGEAVSPEDQRTHAITPCTAPLHILHLHQIHTKKKKNRILSHPEEAKISR